MNISDDAMQQVVAKAIFDSIPEAERQKMITNAIASLLTKQESGRSYGEKLPSKIEEIFAREVYRQAETICSDHVKKSPEIQEKIKALIGKTLEHLLDSQEFTSGFAQAITQMVQKATRY